MKFDLHIHSTASDGRFHPGEIVKMAKKKNLGFISLTDHDTVAGLAEASSTAAKEGIGFINGVELTVSDTTGQMHILGYGFSFTDKKLNSNLKYLRECKEIRNEKIMERLNKLLSENFRYSEIKSGMDEQTVIGRPHIAEFLVRKKVVGNTYEAFQRYLAHDKPAFVQRESLDFEAARELIHQAGGLVFLAHPITMEWKESEIELKLSHMKDMGLDGVEAFNTCQPYIYAKKIFSVAQKLNLMTSAGSDYHGDPNKKTTMGKTSGMRNLNDNMISSVFHQLFNNKNRKVLTN